MAKGIREKISWFLLLVLVTSIYHYEKNKRTKPENWELKNSISCPSARDLQSENQIILF